MALNREDIIKQIEDNRKYYAGHAACNHPGKEQAEGAARALAEILKQIEEYDKFVSLDELTAKIDFSKFPKIEDLDMW